MLEPCQARGVHFTLEKCQLAYALSICVIFEDGTTMDDTTIGQVLGASGGLENVNCVDLVAHLQETNNVYPAVLNDGEQWAQWAHYKYNNWLNPEAARPSGWRYQKRYVCRCQEGSTRLVAR